MTQKIQIKTIISGKVQGVFFRFETKKTADKLGVKGYVKNLTNNDVEAVFQTEKKTMEQMIQWCHKGSKASIVENVQTINIPILSDFQSFEIRY